VGSIPTALTNKIKDLGGGLEQAERRPANHGLTKNNMIRIAETFLTSGNVVELRRGEE
jgi:hypothetical protein